MSPAPGVELGPYRIVSRLGAGGMGEVWKAHDPRLNRDVALKTCTQKLDARFAREARAVAALNHPNICHLYDVGPDFIVMELIDGVPVRGPKPLDEVLKIADQLAAAIDAAHEKGIVHRDLKPGNILITRAGVIKVLDFGLARMPEPDAVDPETSTTITAPPETEIGAVLGTAAYMSPEQARGLAADKRADIWSFGVVIYELLTGTRPFHAHTTTDTLLAVVGKEPDLNKAPYSVRRLLRSCLEKDPKQRLRDIGDWRKLLDLDEEHAVPAAARRSKLVFALGAVAAIAAAAATYEFVHSAHTGPVSIEPIYTRLTDDNGLSDYPTLSRDGKLVAYSSDRAGNGSLDIWLQQIGGREAIQLTHEAEDDTDPSFSPDGTRIVYRSEKDGGGIYVVQTLGGDPILLAPGGRNPRYSPDGKWIAYWTGRGEGSNAPGSAHVYVIDANGGTPRALRPEMLFARTPVWSPRGDAVVVAAQKEAAVDPDHWILPVDSGPPIKTGLVPLLASHGWDRQQIGMRVESAALDWLDFDGNKLLLPVLYGDSANLWEANLDRKGAASGLPHRVTRGPGRQVHASWAITSASERLAFADESLSYDIWIKPLDAAQPTRITNSISTDWAPSLSVNGAKLSFIARHADAWSVVVRDMTTGRDRVVASSTSILYNAALSADGSRVAYTGSHSDIYSTATEGGSSEKLCAHCGTVLSLSADGRYIAFEPVENEDLVVFDSAAHKQITLARRPRSDTVLSGTQLSPDGKWVAFHAIDPITRETQVWIAPLNLQAPVSHENWIPVTDGKTFAQDPGWSPDSHTLYFVSERDGFRCYWAQRLDRISGRPVGDPYPFQHLHSARQTLRGASSAGYLTRPSPGGKNVAFAVAEVRGTVWLEENPHGR